MGELSTSSYRWIILLLATLAQIGLLSSAIWGGMLIAMLPVGLLIDRHGERRLIMVGVTAMALLVLWATQFSTFAWLLILFLLASLGASTSAPGGSKAIAAWFPYSQRGSAMGTRQTGVSIGGLMAAFLLPPVAVRFGWEVGLELAAGVALVAVFFALFYRELPADEGAEGRA